MIPKIIHRVHIGDTESDFIKKCWGTSQKYNTDWDHITHDISNLDMFPLTKDYICKTSIRSLQSDLMRFEILYNYGGYYIDTDIEVFRNFSDISMYDKIVIAPQHQDGFPGTAVIGSKKENKLFLEIISFMKEQIDLDINSTGKINYSPISMFFGPNTINYFLHKNPESFEYLPRETFYPYSWEEPLLANINWSDDLNVYAAHHWNQSWLNPENIGYHDK